jgi:hypothetical protein
VEVPGAESAAVHGVVGVAGGAGAVGHCLEPAVDGIVGKADIRRGDGGVGVGDLLDVSILFSWECVIESLKISSRKD